MLAHGWLDLAVAVTPRAAILLRRREWKSTEFCDEFVAGRLCEFARNSSIWVKVFRFLGCSKRRTVSDGSARICCDRIS